MLNGLSLFSGIGGLDVALSEWVRVIAYCEIDPYCQGVLLSRMADESLCNSPIWDDIKTLRGSDFTGAIDLIYGGFPCQDISIAGTGKGLEGERSGLFFQIVRLAKEIKPSFIFLENVPAITFRGGMQVVREIAEMGYDCRWCVISAASVGALHKRERWFLLAHAYGERLEGFKARTSGTESEKSKSSRTSNAISNTVDTRCNNSRTQLESKIFKQGNTIEQWQKTVSEMGKCSDGISYRVDRLRVLGNSVVPAQVKEAFKILMGIK